MASGHNKEHLVKAARPWVFTIVFVNLITALAAWWWRLDADTLLYFMTGGTVIAGLAVVGPYAVTNGLRISELFGFNWNRDILSFQLPWRGVAPSYSILAGASVIASIITGRTDAPPAILSIASFFLSACWGALTYEAPADLDCPGMTKEQSD